MARYLALLAALVAILCGDVSYAQTIDQLPPVLGVVGGDEIAIWNGSTFKATASQIQTFVNGGASTPIAANSLLGNPTNASAAPIAVPVPPCQAFGDALVWSPGGGFGCATGLAFLAGNVPYTGKITTAASTTSNAGFNLPAGTAPTSPVNGDVWTTSSGMFVQIAGATIGPISAGSGAVASVGLALPSSIFTVSGSPVTGTGTLTGAFANQAANTFFAGPASGGSATPTQRAMVLADLPSIGAQTLLMNPSSAVSGSPSAVAMPSCGAFGDALVYGAGTPGSFGCATGLAFLAGNVPYTGKITTAASTTSNAGFNLPAGTAPTSPVNGDVWTTSGGMFARIAGSTQGPVLSNVVQAPGTTTNDAASPGNLGETLASTVVTCTTTTGATSGTPANVATLALTAGDWDVEGVVGLDPGAGTAIAALVGSVSATSATAGTLGNSGTFQFSAGSGGVGGIIVFDTGPLRMSLATATNVFLVGSPFFGGGTAGLCGRIRARRLR